MIKKPIDTTKEVKFQVSGVFAAGALIFSLIFGFGSVLFLLAYDYHSLHFDLIIGIITLLACLSGLIFSVYTALNSLLLSVNEKEMSGPLIGNIPWSSIKGIYVGSVQPFNGYPTSLKIFLSDGTSKDLSTLGFSIDPYDLLEILRAYYIAHNK